MTPRQQAILAYIRRRHAQALPAPTLREIGEECHISSTSVVAYNLEALVRQGRIRWQREMARGIMLCEKSLPVDMIGELRRELAAANGKIAALYRQLAATEAKVAELQEQLAVERA